MVGTKVLLVLAKRVAIFDYADLKKPPTEILIKDVLPGIIVDFFGSAKAAFGEGKKAGEFSFWATFVGAYAKGFANHKKLAEFKGASFRGYGSYIVKMTWNTKDGADAAFTPDFDGALQE